MEMHLEVEYLIPADQGRSSEPITKWKTICELVLPHSAWSGSCFNVMARPGLIYRCSQTRRRYPLTAYVC